MFRRDAGLVEYLLSFRCPADKTLVQGEHLGPEKGSTPLTLAVETSPFDMASSDERLSIEKRKIVELLLQTGSDPNIPNGKGQTPLALCVVGHMLEEACLPSMKGSALAFAKALLTAGANPNFKPQRSKAGSAWNIAHARGLTEFISLFAAH